MISIPQFDLDRERRPASVPRGPRRDVRRAVGGVSGAIVLAAATVAPIARELRSRRRPRPRPEKAVGA